MFTLIKLKQYSTGRSIWVDTNMICTVRDLECSSGCEIYYYAAESFKIKESADEVIEKMKEANSQ